MKKLIEKLKSKKNLLAYAGIIGGLALLAVIFFSISQYEQAKFKASSEALAEATNQLSKLEDLEETPAVLDKKAWYGDIKDNFTVVYNHNANAYKGTAIPAYLFSTFALIGFGLCLKHADKVKEAEDQD